MRIKATIKLIHPVTQGISKASGSAWKCQEVILGWQEPYGNEGRTREQLIMVTLHGDNVDRLAQQGLGVGDCFEGDISFGTRLFGNRVYNDITAFV